MDNKKYGDALVIDDNKEVLGLTCSVLEDLNLFKNVFSVTDVKSAIRKITNQKFSLIILDYKLENETAFDLLAQLDGSVKNSPSDVIICSGFLDKDILGGAQKAGVKHFISKPFDIDILKKKSVQVLVENGHIKLKQKVKA